MAEPRTRLTLFVEEGPNAGATLRLAPGLHRLGRQLPCEIVLDDPSLADVHALLEINLHGIRVEALNGPVSVRRGGGRDDALPPGEERDLGTSATLRLGASRLRLTVPTVARPQRQRQYALAAAGTLALLLLTIAGDIALRDGSDNAKSPSSFDAALTDAASAQRASRSARGTANAAVADDNTTAQDNVSPAFEAALAPLPTPAAGTQPSEAALPDVSLAEAAEALRAKLENDGLNGIDIALRGDRLEASGPLITENAGAWAEARAWFDRQYGDRFLLIARLQTSDASQRPDILIEAIWAGPEPYLVVPGQGRLYPGDAVDALWRVASIEPQQVVLQRQDGQRITLDMTGRVAEER